MAKLIVGSRGFDMTAWDLSDIATGTVSAGSATEVDVTGAGGQLVYEITGTGFTTFDASGFPTDGTVTGFVQTVPGKTPLTITGLSIAASDFMGFVNTNDATGLETAIFAGTDTLFGRAHDDVLLGCGGNDSFNLTAGGNDTADGGDGNDHFHFDAAFTAADTVDGGTGTDTLFLNGDYHTGVVFTTTTMTEVERIVLQSSGANYSLTFADATIAAGQTLIVDATALPAPRRAIIDNSADTDGHLRFTAGAGGSTVTLSHLGDGDSIHGGIGTDSVVLDGDFSAGITLKHGSLVSIEEFDFTAGHSYKITLDNKFTTLSYNASALGASDSFTFNGAGDLLRKGFQVAGGAGDDTIAGALNNSNFFDLHRGGEDTVTGGGAADTFVFGGALDAGDTLDGGTHTGTTGDDIVQLSGTYVSPLVLGASTFHEIYIVQIASGTTLDLTTNDANVAAGDVLEFQVQGSNFTFDGSAETNGKFDITLRGGTADITGGQGNDLVVANVSAGALTVSDDGGSGNDIFQINLGPSDAIPSTLHFDGGDGTDTLSIIGPSNVTVKSALLTNVENLTIDGGTVKTVDADVAAGATLAIIVDQAHFDGSAETDGAFDFVTIAGIAIGGAGDDIFNYTGGTNHIRGLGGADHMIGFGGPVRFEYVAVSDSTSTTYDTIDGIATPGTVFDMPAAVTAVDAQVTTGALSTATFDSDLAAAVGAAQLGVGHAVIFTPDSGTLAGDHFLIVDANGTAGYQASQDYVILLNQPSSLNFTTANFM